jgi:hypothetical protein
LTSSRVSGKSRRSDASSNGAVRNAVGQHDRRRAEPFERQRHRPRRPAGAEQQRRPRRDVGADGRQRRREAVDVGVFAKETAVAVDDGVDRAGPPRRVRDLVDQRHRRHLVRHGDARAKGVGRAQSGDARRQVSRQRVPSFERRRDAERVERRLMDRRRERMRHRIADHPEPQSLSLPHPPVSLLRRAYGVAPPV